MGIPPEIPVYGDDCSLCFPAGKTPERVHVFFGGINRGQAWFGGLPFPPNRSFILDQSGVYPCRYDLMTDDFLMYVWWTSGLSTIFCETTGFYTVFQAGPSSNCVKYFYNDLTDLPLNAFYGGFAYVTTISALVDLVKTVMPVEESDARFEVTPTEAGNINVRYASKRQGTNILLQFPG